MNNNNIKIIFALVWLRNRLITADLEPVLSHTEKACIVIATHYRKFSTNDKLKIIKLIPARAFGPSGLTKLVLILIFLFAEKYLYNTTAKTPQVFSEQVKIFKLLFANYKNILLLLNSN